ncbi:uncharacterized protein MAM_02166 [Metarhizium album ARSEF 1941]|uniref:Uncharacterized protein n=1 Tax=Metarhizium album (strain ARSEF 1941) TaxID=1081103 RepID=A0A0B2X3F4_METAS|nr:uncharacterized protein MAM_02166 [Metarhizium album ARSEF 1941]KHO00243.1 hypothetical protein MAM_02166 [Metarhizium album ARSEF 1941]
MARGRVPFKNRLLHEKHGPVVRVAPDELSFNAARAWEDIYGSEPSGHTRLPRGPSHLGSVDPLNGVYPLSAGVEPELASPKRRTVRGVADAPGNQAGAAPVHPEALGLRIMRGLFEPKLMTSLKQNEAIPYVPPSQHSAYVDAGTRLQLHMAAGHEAMPSTRQRQDPRGTFWFNR